MDIAKKRKFDLINSLKQCSKQGPCFELKEEKKFNSSSSPFDIKNMDNLLYFQSQKSNELLKSSIPNLETIKKARNEILGIEEKKLFSERDQLDEIKNLVKKKTSEGNSLSDVRSMFQYTQEAKQIFVKAIQELNYNKNTLLSRTNQRADIKLGWKGMILKSSDVKKTKKQEKNFGWNYKWVQAIFTNIDNPTEKISIKGVVPFIQKNAVYCMDIYFEIDPKWGPQWMITKGKCKVLPPYHNQSLFQKCISMCATKEVPDDDEKQIRQINKNIVSEISKYIKETEESMIQESLDFQSWLKMTPHWCEKLNEVGLQLDYVAGGFSSEMFPLIERAYNGGSTMENNSWWDNLAESKKQLWESQLMNPEKAFKMCMRASMSYALRYDCKDNIFDELEDAPFAMIEIDDDEEGDEKSDEQKALSKLMLDLNHLDFIEKNQEKLQQNKELFLPCFVPELSLAGFKNLCRYQNWVEPVGGVTNERKMFQGHTYVAPKVIADLKQFILGIEAYHFIKNFLNQDDCQECALLMNVVPERLHPGLAMLEKHHVIQVFEFPCKEVQHNKYHEFCNGEENHKFIFHWLWAECKILLAKILKSFYNKKPPKMETLPEEVLSKYNDKQRQILEDVQNNSMMCLIGEGGTGKCLGKNTPVIMFNGSVKMSQNIEKGDHLMGDDNHPRSVLSVTSGTDKMYKIQCADSKLLQEPYIVNSKHIICLKLHKALESQINERNKTFTWKWYENFERKTITFSLDQIKDAYLWKESLIHKRDLNRDGDILDISIEDYMIQTNEWKNDFFGYTHVGIDCWNPNKSTVSVDPYMFGCWLANFLLEDNYGGFMPLEYKCGSLETREALINGIIDCNKHLGVFRGFYFTDSSQPLFQDLLFVARSLGFSIQIESKCICNFVINKGYPIHVEELAEKYEYFGFCIDGNKRFLLGDFTVTHNTECISLLDQAFPGKVTILGFTGRSVDEVQNRIKNAKCSTIHSWKLRKGVKAKGILVLDETSMISERLFMQLMAVIQHFERIVFVGDPMQLQAFGHWKGVIFRELIWTLYCLELETNYRMLKNPDSKILPNCRKIRNGDGKLQFDMSTFIFTSKPLLVRLQELIDEHAKTEFKDIIFLSPTNQAVDFVNYKCKKVYHEGKYCFESSEGIEKSMHFFKYTFVVGDGVIFVDPTKRDATKDELDLYWNRKYYEESNQWDSHFKNLFRTRQQDKIVRIFRILQPDRLREFYRQNCASLEEEESDEFMETIDKICKIRKYKDLFFNAEESGIKAKDARHLVIPEAYIQELTYVTKENEKNFEDNVNVILVGESGKWFRLSDHFLSSFSSTINSFQGSEKEFVAFYYPDHDAYMEKFCTRKLLYTVCSRTKKTFYYLGKNPQDMKSMIKNDPENICCLGQFIKMQ